jgi:hypothetical protein
MNRRRVLLISSVIIALLAISFVLGAFYSPYARISAGGLVVESVPSVPEVVSETRFEPSKPQSDVAVQERMVIYNAYISLETGDIEERLAKIRQIAEQYDGYVAGSSRSSYGTQASAEISIRVPKERFHTVVQEIETYGKVLDERTTSEDITQQYIDLKARLVNLQKQEERLHELLKIAKTVDEILRVENELTRIRGEIDSLQGQINYLEGNVEMSLVSVTLTEPAPPFTPPGMNWGETFKMAIIGLFTILRGMIILAVSLVPLVIIGAPVYYVYKRRKAGPTK